MNAENLFAKVEYAAKWSISDFYDEEGEMLEETIKAGKPFRAAWGCKKEIVYADVAGDGETIAATVTVGVDELPDLLDSAIWEAENKQDNCGSSAFTRLFGKDSAEHFENLLDECTFAYQESFTEYQSCKNDFEDLTELLDRLETEANDAAERCYKTIIELAKTYIAENVKP